MYENTIFIQWKGFKNNFKKLFKYEGVQAMVKIYKLSSI